MRDNGQFLLPIQNSTTEEKISYYYSKQKGKVHLTSPKHGMLEILLKETRTKTHDPTTINKIIKDEFKSM